MKTAAWAAFTVVLVAGCGSRGVAGKWRAKEISPPSSTEIGRKFDQLKLKSTVEFKSDGTMTLAAGSLEVDGTYKSNGNSIEVTMPGIANTPPSVAVYELSADGRTLTRTESSSNTKVIFERA